MSPEISRIIQELKKEPFNQIPEPEKFAELIEKVYWKNGDKVITELRKMILWIYANPERAPKKRFKKFIVGWLNRTRW